MKIQSPGQILAYYQSSDIQGLCRLRMCRILCNRKLQRKFFGKIDYALPEVAEFIGLSSSGLREYDRAEAAKEAEELRRRLEQEEQARRREPVLCRNVREFGRLLALNAVERELLLFHVLKDHENYFKDLLEWIEFPQPQDYLGMLSVALDVQAGAVLKAMEPQSRLLNAGVLAWLPPGPSGHSIGTGLPGLSRKLLEEPFRVGEVVRTVVKPAPQPTLRYADYPHLRETLRYLRPFLRQVLREKGTGVNIFLHGVPGTGKSELTRVLAKEMRARLFEVSSEEEDGDSVAAGQRMMSLLAGQQFLRSQRSLVVFDEAEDIFEGQHLFARSLAAMRKGWMNRFLETNPVPVFWLSNNISGMDQAFLRRFSFVVELPIPPKSQREKAIRRICGRRATKQTIERLAGCEHLSPAVLAQANEVTKTIARADDTVSEDRALHHLVHQSLDAMGHGRDLPVQGDNGKAAPFSLDYINCETPVRELAAEFDSSSCCRICLYGPPGTGKTSFGQWLARKVDRPLLIKCASDILSPYVGKAEQNLARVFGRAQEEGAVLMIDEVDTFLQDRRHAQRPWEISQVNEFLTQMENFAGLFIASTNLMEGLDKASLRRFDLKLRFDYLRCGQARSLLRNLCRELKLSRPDSGDYHALDKLSMLTPGDFANVARQHRFRSFSSAAAFVRLLRLECDHKGRAPAGELGFGEG